MNGPHDLGGAHGLGPVAPEKEVKWRPALFLSSSTSSSITRIYFRGGREIEVGSPNSKPTLKAHLALTLR